MKAQKATYKCPDCFISHNSPAELFIHLRLEHTFDEMRYEHVDEEFRESDEESSDEDDSQEAITLYDEELEFIGERVIGPEHAPSMDQEGVEIPDLSVNGEQNNNKEAKEKTSENCPICSAEIDKRCMKTHFIKQHKDGKQKCMFCPAYFITEKHLSKHTKLIHGENRII